MKKSRQAGVKPSDFTGSTDSMNLFLSGAAFVAPQHHTKEQKKVIEKNEICAYCGKEFGRHYNTCIYFPG